MSPQKAVYCGLKKGRVWRCLPWLILLVGTLVTWQIHHLFTQRQLQTAQARFDVQASAVATALKRHVQANVDLLRGVASLFVSSDAVDRSEFHSYVDGLRLDVQYPGIQGVGFSQRVPATQIQAHVRAVRHEGMPTYTIQPEGARELYTSILYLEPFDWRNQRAFGYDMYTEPLRRQAMALAARSGEAALTGKVRLLQETDVDEQPGFLIYVPVYRKGAATHSDALRLQALEGWAYSPLRSHNFVNSILATDFPELGPHIDLQLYAGPRNEPQDLLYATAPSAEPAVPFPRPVDTVLDMHGVQWLLHMAPRSTYEAEHPRWLWGVAIVASGGVLTLLLVLLAVLNQRHHDEVSQALSDSVVAVRQLEENQVALRLAGTVMRASSMGIMVTDADKHIVSVNPAFTLITGYSEQEVLGQSPHFLAAAPQSIEFQQQMWQCLEQFGHWEGELQNRRKNGSLYPELLSITRVTNASGEVENYVGLFQDITTRRQTEERIRHLAHHDYLTGLPNRALLVERALQELNTAKRYGRRPALLFIDLDRFKPINDTHGHEVGDAVLIEIAQRLKALLRDSDLICRQGGDEFVVLLPDHVSEQGLVNLADKLLQAIEAPCDCQGHHLTLSASIGIAHYPEHGDTVDALIQRADSAMYRAKTDAHQRIYLAEASAHPPATA